MRRNLTIALTASLISASCFAQFNPVWNVQYQHTTSSNFSNEARKVVVDPMGNLFALGDLTSDIDMQGVQGATTHHYITVIKYSTTGSISDKLIVDVTDHITNGFDNLNAFGLETDAGGDVYIGYTAWKLNSGFDVVLARYDNSLNLISQSSFSLPGAETGVDFKLHPSGTMYAIVKSVDLDVTYYLIKSAPSFGAAVIVYTFPANVAVLNSLALDGGQNAYVAGYVIKGGSKNALVGAVNFTTGYLTWSSIYNNNALVGDDVANQITVGSDGNIYTVGTSYQGALAGNQVLVLKNAPGSSRFQFVVLLKGTQSNELGVQINASENGWLYIGASSAGLASVYRIPSNGNFTTPGHISLTPYPTAPYTSISNVRMNDMKVTSAKNIYITGAVEASGPSGNFTSSYLFKVGVLFGNALVKLDAMNVEGAANQNLEGISIGLDFSKVDIFLLRNFWSNSHATEAIFLDDLNVPSPLRKTFAGDPFNITLNPNPAKSIVNMTSNSIIEKVEILDAMGKQVAVLNPRTSAFSFDISSLPPGMYLCQLSSETGIVNKKLIVE